MQDDKDFDYDIALSFAGDDRTIVEDLVVRVCD